MSVLVLRLGHRPERDKRISTHVGLVARAFGADGIVYSGVRDTGLERSLKNVAENWGGEFEIRYERAWKDFIKRWPGKVVQLSMYGIPIQNCIAAIRKHRNLLVVVGGVKVPAEVYELADYNVAVTSQPHSEVAALAIFLDRLFQGKELDKSFAGKLRIVPQKKGKKVIKTHGKSI